MLIGFFFVLFFLNFFNAQLFTFRNFNHKNGLKLSSVLSINQDNDGFIWLGTDGAGLQKFDGHTIANISNKNTQNEHHVSCIDPVNDEIYFSSLYEGFFKLKNNKYIRLHHKSKDFGEHIGIKKREKSLVCIGTKKIEIVKNEKTTAKYKLDSPITSLIQIVSHNELVFIVTKELTLVVCENKIQEINAWLKTKSNLKVSFVSTYKNKISLYSRTQNSKKNIFLTSKNTIDNITEETFLLPKIETIKNVYSKNNQLIILDSLNNLYYLKGNKVNFLPKNFKNNNFELNTLFIDKNDDFWATSLNAGFFKISSEPFSKIDLHPVYQNPLISFIYRSKYNEVFLSDYNQKTYVGSFKRPDFKEFPFRIFGQTEFQNQQLFASNKGVLKFENEKFIPFNKIEGKVIFIHSLENTLFYFIEQKGLFKFENGLTSKLSQNFNFSHVYSGQINKFKTKIYFGTNDGIFEYTFLDKRLKLISKKFKVKASFSGTSTMDCFGTVWFTFDKNLVGITKEENYITISDKKHFQSTLFYTLNSDKFGNLWIGTNSGLTQLNIDKYGHVLYANSFDKTNGFDGYETHMRSSFQDYNLIFIGTIEGLFLINPASLENIKSPPKPFIFQTNIKNSKQSVYDEDLIKLNFLSINPKFPGIKYTYRLKGKNLNWSNLSSETSAYFANLSDQDYLFEVKSSYNGISFSESSSFKLINNSPFWKSKWFILFLIISIALANIIVLDRTKSIENSSLQKNENAIDVSNTMKSIILLFGLIATTVSNFLSNYLDKTIPNLLELHVPLAIIMTSLFIVSLSKFNRFNINKNALSIAFYSILMHAYLGIYLSNIHPYYVIIIALTCALTPIVLNNYLEILVISIVQVIISSCFVFLLDNVLYNELLFILAIIVSISVSLFNSYIKNETFQKLYFISSLINKSDYFLIAYDQNNKITYISDYCAKYLKINPFVLIDNSINTLNQLIHSTFKEKDYNFITAFNSEKKLTLPMKDKYEKLIWMEWENKRISKKLSIIFGKEITDQIKIKEKYDYLYNNSDFLVYFVDIQGKIKEYNNAFEQLFVNFEDNSFHHDALSLVCEEDFNRVKSFYQNQFKEKITNDFIAFKIIDKSKNTIHLAQKSILIFQNGSKKIISGFLCIASNVSEINKLNDFVKTTENKANLELKETQALQQLFLPSPSKFKSVFYDAAILFKPKNHISSNFYFVEKQNDDLYLIIGDLKQDGYLGTILSVFIQNFLIELFQIKKGLNCNQILNSLEEKIAGNFKSSPEFYSKIEIETVVFKMNCDTKKINYASAGGKFISLLDGETILHRGESKFLGEIPKSNFLQYNDYELNYNKIDYLFFYTDGMINQENKDLNKTFSIKRLLEIVKKDKNTSIQDKVKNINDIFDQWKENSPQNEDFTLIGIKI